MLSEHVTLNNEPPWSPFASFVHQRVSGTMNSKGQRLLREEVFQEDVSKQ
jgi:hypothetical protein